MFTSGPAADDKTLVTCATHFVRMAAVRRYFLPHCRRLQGHETDVTESPQPPDLSPIKRAIATVTGVIDLLPASRRVKPQQSMNISVSRHQNHTNAQTHKRTNTQTRRCIIRSRVSNIRPGACFEPGKCEAGLLILVLYFN